MSANVASGIELLPRKFMGGWRKGQARAWSQLQHSRKRFVVLNLPTGVGKSPLYMGHIAAMGGRGVALTSTKALQTQLMADFKTMGLVDIRGMGNYPCRMLERDGNYMCDDGPCRDGEKCEYKASGCSYFDQLHLAQGSSLVVSNYDTWFAQRRYQEGLGDVDVLVCDEAHDAIDKLSDYMRVEVEDGKTIGRTPQIDDMVQWKEWAKREATYQRSFAATQFGIARRRMNEFASKLDRLAEATEDWLAWRTKGRWNFQPVWPRPYSERWLWGGVDRIVLSSATLQRKQLDYLGLEPEDYDWIEVPSPFPAGRRPIYQIDCVKMRYEMEDAELAWWVKRNDQIIGGRLDRKGILHSVSFDRGEMFAKNSKHKQHVMLHDRDTPVKTIVDRYLQAKPPVVLVSPSVHTGFDFEGDACRYQIVSKVPFPPKNDPLVAARLHTDRKYMGSVAVQKIVQATGRPMRSVEDWAETFITDNMVKMLVRAYRDMIPLWWKQAYKEVASIPPAPKLR